MLLPILFALFYPSLVQAPVARYVIYPMKPVPKIEPKHTQIASRSVSLVQTHYTQFTVTAYTSGPESTGKSPGDVGYGITASGTHIQLGDCAADEKYPFGTKLFIVGYGTVVVRDRGGLVKGNHIDIYMPNLQDAINFGRKTMEVQVIP